MCQFSDRFDTTDKYVEVGDFSIPVRVLNQNGNENIEARVLFPELREALSGLPLTEQIEFVRLMTTTLFTHLDTLEERKEECIQYWFIAHSLGSGRYTHLIEAVLTTEDGILLGIVIADHVLLVGDSMSYEFTSTKSDNNGAGYKTSSGTELAEYSLLFSPRVTEPQLISAGQYPRESEELEIPEGVVELGPRAFASYKNLRRIKLPSTLKRIAQYVFSRCESLEEIDIPARVAEIGNGAFEGCKSLRSVRLPEGLTTIRTDLFRDCSKLEAVHIPRKVTEIWDGAFRGCEALQKIKLPSGLTEICDDTFMDCRILATLKIPEAVQEIGENAFRNCIALETELPPELCILRKRAFYNCQSLKKITIPYTLNGVGESAFSCCDMLSRVRIEEGPTYLRAHAFGFCKSLTEIYLPDSITDIGDEAFVNCKALERARISPKAERLGDDIFDGCPNVKIYHK